jgi:L-cysteine:1D-myo-inositol 2-amino-2-deoxy-alpha-D-glucopyranoside ligase
MSAVLATGVRLYDTVQGKVVPFVVARRTVQMYTCGLTPNEPADVGHAVTFLAYDVLQRRLRDLGFPTRCVRNVTDVDDDMVARSTRLGIRVGELASQVVAGFNRSMNALGLLPCHIDTRSRSVGPGLLRATDERRASEGEGGVLLMSTRHSFRRKPA